MTDQMSISSIKSSVRDSDIKLDKVSIKSSARSSKKSVSKKKSILDMGSDDIDMSQLEMMANKRKMAKVPEIISVEQVVKPVTISEKPKKTRKKTTVSSSDSSSSSSSNSVDKKKRREKLISKENKSDQIRREKSEYLFKFNKVNATGKWSSLKLDMNNHTLDEIRNEYERVTTEMRSDRSVSFFKRMLLLGVQGVEMMNNKFDPLGVDLDGWSEAMGYSMENQEYDEVMAELCEKYKGTGNT